MRIITRCALVCVLCLGLLFVPTHTETRTCGTRPTSISAAGASFIQHEEGFRSTAYAQGASHAIGFGMHSWKGRPVTLTYPGRVTRQEALKEFQRQIVQYEQIVLRVVCVSLTQTQYDALVSVAWTLGKLNTSLTRKLHTGEPVVLRDFTVTATINGRPARGLLARRQRENQWFIQP